MKKVAGIVCLQFFAFCFLFSCTNDPKEVEPFVSIEGLPIEVMKKAELRYTEKGNIKVKIVAEKIERYPNKNPSVYFSEGVLVYFYNDSTSIISILTADQASIDDKNQQMIAQANVVLINQKQEKLNTEQLIWDEKSNLIFTKKAVRISTEDEVIFGDGFESNPDFSSYKITNVRGSINIKQSNDSLIK